MGTEAKPQAADPENDERDNSTRTDGEAAYEDTGEPAPDVPTGAEVEAEVEERAS